MNTYMKSRRRYFFFFLFFNPLPSSHSHLECEYCLIPSMPPGDVVVVVVVFTGVKPTAEADASPKSSVRSKVEYAAEVSCDRKKEKKTWLGWLGSGGNLVQVVEIKTGRIPNGGLLFGKKKKKNMQCGVQAPRAVTVSQEWCGDWGGSGSL